METTTLYNLLNDGLLQKWREKIIKEESESLFFVYEQEALKELKTDLDEKSKKLLVSYALALEDRADYIHSILKNKILSLGIKIGLELNKDFAEFED